MNSWSWNILFFTFKDSLNDSDSTCNTSQNQISSRSGNFSEQRAGFSRYFSRISHFLHSISSKLKTPHSQYHFGHFHSFPVKVSTVCCYQMSLFTWKTAEINISRVSGEEIKVCGSQPKLEHYCFEIMLVMNR